MIFLPDSASDFEDLKIGDGFGHGGHPTYSWYKIGGGFGHGLGGDNGMGYSDGDDYGNGDGNGQGCGNYHYTEEDGNGKDK